jgi:hypothetical protein
VDAELVIQQETSLAQTVTSKTRVNVPIHGPSNIDSVRTKTIVVGATESGKIARVLDIKSAASLAGMDIKTQQLTTAPTKTNRFHVNDAVRRQTVMKTQSQLNISRNKFPFPN